MRTQATTYKLHGRSNSVDDCGVRLPAPRSVHRNLQLVARGSGLVLWVSLQLAACNLCLGFQPAWAESVPVEEAPPLSAEVHLTATEKSFGARGRIGTFVLPPSRVGIFEDVETRYAVPGGGAADSGDHAIKIMYDKRPGQTFCGAYLMIAGDLSAYKTLTFMVKGAQGGESFEIGLNDVVANRREDAVLAGSVYRFLKGGVTTEWQEVRVSLSDFYGVRLDQVMSVAWLFSEEGSGAFWIDRVRLHTEGLVDRQAEVRQQGYLLLDDFDHSDLNLLGRRTNTYKRLPSVCAAKRVTEGAYGASGRSLQLTYHKESSGWCGYYSLLNVVDGPFYDLSPFVSVSFRVRGAKGGESFEIGMADENWMIIGDSLKAGPVEKYLPGGVTTEWQRVEIPLRDFGALNLTRMGSIVFNCYRKGDGEVFIDQLTFHLSKDAVVAQPTDVR